MRRRRSYAITTVLLLTLLLALPACGVRIFPPDPGTEVFKDLDLTGDRRVGRQLTLALEVANVYPVPVEIACLYEDGDKLTDDQEKIAFVERATRVGDVTLQPLPDARPDVDEDEAPRETLTFRFTVARPGDYVLVCLTPAAPENGILKSFKIR